VKLSLTDWCVAQTGLLEQLATSRWHTAESEAKTAVGFLISCLLAVSSLFSAYLSVMSSLVCVCAVWVCVLCVYICVYMCLLCVITFTVHTYNTFGYKYSYKTCDKFEILK
jgi:hypothetical protein